MRFKIITTVLFFVICTFSHAQTVQTNRIKYNPDPDEDDIGTFMSMVGFDYHKFVIKSDKSPYVNVYIDEYLNDNLINSYDHVSANKSTAPKNYFRLIFTKLDTADFTLKIYTLSKSDSIETIKFKIGELGLYRKLRVNKKDFAYSWKRANFNENDGPIVEIGKKIPLLYYATAVIEKVDGKTINAFCNVPNILMNKSSIYNKGKIEHYFEIGLELIEKIE